MPPAHAPGSDLSIKGEWIKFWGQIVVALIAILSIVIAERVKSNRQHDDVVDSLRTQIVDGHKREADLQKQIDVLQERISDLQRREEKPQPPEPTATERVFGTITYIYRSADERLDSHACRSSNGRLICPFTYRLGKGQPREITAETARAWSGVRVRDNFGVVRKRLAAYFLTRAGTKVDKMTLGAGESARFVLELDMDQAVSEVTILAINPEPPDNPYYDADTLMIQKVPVTR